MEPQLQKPSISVPSPLTFGRGSGFDLFSPKSLGGRRRSILKLESGQGVSSAFFSKAKRVTFNMQDTYISDSKEENEASDRDGKLFRMVKALTGAEVRASVWVIVCWTDPLIPSCLDEILNAFPHLPLPDTGPRRLPSSKQKARRGSGVPSYHLVLSI